MFIKRPAIIAASLILTLLAATSALACACCVNKGHYEFGLIKPGEMYSSIFEEIKMRGAAELYMTEAGLDIIKGLLDLAKDDAEGKTTKMELTSSFDRKVWRITLDAGEDRKGTLVLPMPARIRKHAADLDGIDTGLWVTLYKEIAIEGRVSSATGILKSARGAEFMLLFQGKGRGCDEVTDFDRWRLGLSGPRASYELFGNTK